MIEIIGMKEAARIALPDTTIGTCNYTVSKFEITGEMIHNVVAVNGLKLQWITEANSFSLLTFVDEAIAKIAELHPEPEDNPEPPEVPPPLNW